MSELAEIRERLTVLETRSAERREQNKQDWKSHSTQSKIIWTVIDDKLDLLIRHKDDQVLHKEKCMLEAKSYTKSLVGWILGVPTTIVAIISIIWGIKRILMLCIVMCFFLVSCSTIAKDYRYIPDNVHADKDGMVLVRKLELNKSGSVKSLPNGEMSLDTREPNLWTKYATPVLSGAVGTAKENAGAL